jgi:hypothetical protein
MVGWDTLDVLFVVTAFLFQVILVVHFAVRKWHFATAMRYGPIVYGLSVPAAATSVVLFLGGKGWSFWLAGFLYLGWSLYGYAVEYAKRIEWRDPIRWPIFGSYILLYLATVMCYWWPLALLDRALWYGYALLFVVSTVLNVSSHGRAAKNG